MKKKNFLFIFSDSVIICNESLTKKIVFEDQGISNPSYEVMAAIISDSLRDLEFEQNENVLVLGSQFIHCTKKLTSHVKKDQKEPFKMIDCRTNILKNPNSAESLIFNERSGYIFQGKKLSSFESIPLLQKYYVRRKFSSYSADKINILLNSFEKYEIEIDSLIPFASFAEELSLYYECETPVVCVEIEKTSMGISVISNGVIVKTINLGNGIDKIIENVSNTFNISNKVAAKLVDFYGFVFLPMTYLDVIVDIPIYGDLVNSIALPDLSFTIRESIKQMIDELIVNIRPAINCDSADVSYIIQTDFKKKGLIQLMKLMLNENVSQFDNQNIEYCKLINAYQYLLNEDAEYKAKLESTIEKKSEPVMIQEEAKTSNRIVDKLAVLFNEKLKPFLAESDQF